MAQIEADKAKLLESYNLTESLLQVKCSEEHIANIQEFISWDKVGRHLPNITRRNLRDIERDGRDQESRRGLLLDMWEDSNGNNATYDAMITAMLRAGKMAEATNVCQLLVPEEG